jgi:hypothetical protein
MDKDNGTKRFGLEPKRLQLGRVQIPFVNVASDLNARPISHDNTHFQRDKITTTNMARNQN